MVLANKKPINIADQLVDMVKADIKIVQAERPASYADHCRFCGVLLEGKEFIRCTDCAVEFLNETDAEHQEWPDDEPDDDEQEEA